MCFQLLSTVTGMFRQCQASLQRALTSSPSSLPHSEVCWVLKHTHTSTGEKPRVGMLAYFHLISRWQRKRKQCGKSGIREAKFESCWESCRGQGSRLWAHEIPKEFMQGNYQKKKKKRERELNLALGKKRSLWYKGLTGHNPIREEVVNGGYRRQGR